MLRPGTAVLIIDPSPDRDDLATRLKAAGVVAAPVADPDDAHIYLRNLIFDMVVVDLDRDPARARRVLDEVGRRQPGAVRVTTSGAGSHGYGFPMLRKPFTVDALLSCAS